MEIILLLCSSGVAGLFTYIYLDYLSLLDTEKPEIKKMFSILFSLVSIGIFLLIIYFINLFYNNDFWEIIIAFVITALLFKPINNFVYPLLINNFRKNMNKKRESNDLNPLDNKHAIDTILQKSNMFYVEKYKDTDKPVYQGILLRHELTNELDSIFSIKPTPIIENYDKVINQYYYQPKNTDEYYKFYSLKN